MNEESRTFTINKESSKMEDSFYFQLIQVQMSFSPLTSCSPKLKAV